ncbi:MFS transporter [Nonomuraea dietziae]|uniref:MFS transporter n=1 Tax=Nonomuraea dietziae TaxID=65515 RepID=UPI0034283A50
MSAGESALIRPLWRNRDFLLLWWGQAASALGSTMAALVYPLLALLAGGSATAAGLVGLAGVGAGAIVRLPSGVLADRWPRKRIMICSDAIRALVVGSVATALIFDGLTLPHLVLAAVLTGVCDVLFDSAQAVAVRHVVPVEQLPRAVAQNEARAHVAGLVGQPLGGLLYGFGVVVPVLVDAFSYLLSGVLNLLIRNPLSDPPTAAPRRAWRHDLAVGMRYVWSQPYLQASMLAAAGFQLVFTGLTLAIIASAKIQGSAAVHIGMAFALGGIGGIGGAWAAGRVQARFAPSTLVYGFGWTAALCVAAMGWVANPYVLGALLALVYFAATPANAMLMALQIHVTPPELHGRVLSAAMFIASCAAPLGPPLAGVLLDRVGITPAFLALAVLTGAITVAMHLSPAIRTMRRPS